tara:strand:- start:2215 stop:2343 length:129 start_codon:yes stop_codon:yes gene_type:complete
MIPVSMLRRLLTKEGLDFKIVKVIGNVAQVNIIVAEDSDVHS